MARKKTFTFTIKVGHTPGGSNAFEDPPPLMSEEGEPPNLPGQKKNEATHKADKDKISVIVITEGSQTCIYHGGSIY